MAEIPERRMRIERLQAIRDWDNPKYSTGVNVSRNETVQMARRVLEAEARIRELETQLQKMRPKTRTVERIELSPAGHEMHVTDEVECDEE